MNIGGPARHATILHQGLVPQGFQSVLVHGLPTADEASFDALLDGRGFRSVRLPRLGRRVTPLEDLVSFWALLRLVFAEQPDIVHTHTAKAGTLGRLAGFLFNLTRSRRRRCVLVHTFHGHVLNGYFGPVGTAAVLFAERSLARVTDVIVTISARQRDDIVGRFRIAPGRKVTMIPLGLELDELLSTSEHSPLLRHALGWTADEFVVGFVGRLAPIKDLPTLLQGFAAFAAGCPRARLLIVGDGEQRAQTEMLVHALGLDGVSRFAGWQHDLQRVYGAIDVLALTSKNEGTPVAIIEALAARVPVVATEVGGVADVVRRDETGLLIDAGNHEALASALARLESDPVLRRRLGDRGRPDVAERFSRQRLVLDVSDCYRRLLRQREGAAGAGSAASR